MDFTFKFKTLINSDVLAKMSYHFAEKEVNLLKAIDISSLLLLSNAVRGNKLENSRRIYSQALKRSSDTIINTADNELNITLGSCMVTHNDLVRILFSYRYIKASRLVCHWSDVKESSGTQILHLFSFITLVMLGREILRENLDVEMFAEMLQENGRREANLVKDKMEQAALLNGYGSLKSELQSNDLSRGFTGSAASYFVRMISAPFKWTRD